MSSSEKLQMLGRLVFTASLVLFLFPWGAAAGPLTWTLNGVTFDDGGRVHGTFTYDATSAVMLDWNLSVEGGNTGVFAPFTYSPSNSVLAPGHGGIGFIFFTPVFNVPRRDLRLFFEMPLRDTGGTIPLDTTHLFSVECFNCGPFRLIVSGNAAAPTPVPAVKQATIDLDPNLFKVEVGIDQKPKESEGQFLTAFIEPPDGVSAADIDVSTVTLSINGTALATAESPVIVGNVLKVLFRLDLTNVGTILGLEVTEVKVDDEKIKVNAISAPTQPIDLIELNISGDLISGGSFGGTDAVRLMLKE